jgi:hypothetical protein
VSAENLAFEMQNVVPQIVFLAAEERFLPIGRLELELGLGWHAEFSVLRRDAPTKPKKAIA